MKVPSMKLSAALMATAASILLTGVITLTFVRSPGLAVAALGSIVIGGVWLFVFDQIGRAD